MHLSVSPIGSRATITAAPWWNCTVDAFVTGHESLSVGEIRLTSDILAHPLCRKPNPRCLPYVFDVLLVFLTLGLALVL